MTLLLLWVFGGLLWEGQQLWAVGPRGYWADHFNRVDIVGFVLSLVALGMAAANIGGEDLERTWAPVALPPCTRSRSSVGPGN